MLSAISEPVVGAAVVRTYAIEERTQVRIDEAIARHQQASTRAQGLTAFSFSLGGISAGLANAGVIVIGIQLGLDGQITSGEVLAFAFLVTLFVGPVQIGTQVLTDAQNAVAGWRRVIGILDTPADLDDPGPDGADLPPGALDIDFRRRGLRLPRRAAGAPRRHRARRGRHPGGRRRRDGVGQDHLRQAAHAADGPQRRQRRARRRRRTPDRVRLAAATAWCWCRRRGSSSTRRCCPTSATAGSAPPRDEVHAAVDRARPGRLARRAADGSGHPRRPARRVAVARGSASWSR